MRGKQEKFATAVNVKGINRPVKVAYLVPFNNSIRTNAILDAVFDESYSRWGGVSTLIIPVVYYDFLFEQFEKWIEVFDPDYIISFVHITQKFINKIKLLTNPIYIKKETVTKDNAFRRNGYRFNLRNADSYVSSVSTVSSPYAIRRRFGRKSINVLPVILTHFPKEKKDFFVSNNFGTSLKYNSVTYPIDGLFDTLCFTDGAPIPHHSTGSKEAESVIDVMRSITEDYVIPISRLSAIEGRSDYKVKNRKISEYFNIFVGDTAFDRINFWNSRHFSVNYFNNAQSLIVNKSLCDNDDFLQCLGKYLNEFNSSGEGGQAQVRLWSQKLCPDELSNIGVRLTSHTYNAVGVHPYSNSFILPDDSEFEFYGARNEIVSYKLFEKENELVAIDPYHFKFVPPRFKGLLSGVWFYDFDVERHENLSIYSNVVDKWCPAWRPGVNKVFSNNTGRVTRNNKLAIIPTTGDNIVIGDSSRTDYKLNINLPDDYSYFDSLVCQSDPLYQDDLRGPFSRKKYKYINTSDKGQNLRGVISMFESLSSCYDCLCNSFWQNLICSEISYFDLNKLRGLLPRSRDKKESLRIQYRFDTISKINRYLQCSLLDSIENLIAKKIILQFFNWKCGYCGNQNYVNVDSLGSVNKCNICSKEDDLPIDFDWTFKVNDFVKTSLHENNGMSVLWALGYMQNCYHYSIRDVTSERKYSFYYMPEVDLFTSLDNKKNDHEIDLLCMVKGKFHAIEVKKNAFGFACKEREIHKYIQIVRCISPDVALLMFEDYHDDESMHSEVKNQLAVAMSKVRENISSDIEVKSIVRSEVRRDTDPHDLLGWFGKRLHQMWME